MTEEPTPEATEEPAPEVTEEPAPEAAETPAAEQTGIPAAVAAEEAPRFVHGYAYVKAGEKVYADDELDEVLGTFPEKAVVYVSDREETQDEDQDILTLRFACDDELVKGYIRAKRVQPLSERETADYEEEAAEDGVRYRDQIFVMSVAFDFTDAAVEQPAAEETEQPAAEETEQPAAEETEQPAAEETETPAADVTETPAAEETEQPAAEETETPAADVTETPAAEETEAPEQTEAHTWNNGVCEDCGAVCAHEQTTSQRYEHAIDQQSIVDNGDGTHTYQAGCYVLHQCSDCGMQLGYELEGELDSVTAAHEFGEDGACWICGAANACTHPAESSVKRTLSYIAGVVETGEHYHVIDYDLVSQMYCQACGQLYGEQTAMGTQRRTEAHFFGENGVCNCGATGEPCADWEAHFKASEQHTALENIRTEQVTGEDGQMHEQTVATQVTGKQCALCGGFVGEVALAQVTTGQNEVPNQADAPAFEGELAGWDNPVTVTKIEQTGDKTIRLTWEGAESTAAYRVFEVVGDVEKLKKTVTTGTTVTLTGVAVGTHEFVLRPYDPASGQNGTNSHRVKFVVQSVAWKVAPVISAGAQVGGQEGLVKLTWTHKSRAESYAIYDTVGGTKTKIATTTELSIILEDQAPGKHSYTVQPVQKDSWGNEKTGTSSKAKLLTVAALWNKKPTIASGVQRTSLEPAGEMVEGLVELTIKRPAGALTQAYVVQEYIASPKGWVFVEGGEKIEDAATVSIQLANVAPGAHSYRVRPATLNEYGDIVRDPETGLPLASALGTPSATKVVTVAALWNKKGTLAVCRQQTDKEGKVMLTWHSGSPLTQAWQICERTSRKVGGKMTYIYTPVEVGSRDYILSSDATVTQVIDAELGTHYYAVRPVLVSDKGEVTPGDISAVKAVTVKELWKSAPVITSLAQVDGVGADGVVATVELTWNAGSELTQAFRVYDKVGTAKTAKYTPVTDVIVGETSATIELKKTGVHSFIVYPVNLEDDNKLGTASAAKAITVKAATWKDAPTLTAVQMKDNAEGEVLLRWSQIVPADAFKIFEYKNKQNVPVQVDGEALIVLSEAQVLLEGVTAGTHSYKVQPLRFNQETGDYEAGTLSAAKAVTVVTQWRLAPTITEAKQLTDEEGVVSLKWKAGSPLTQGWYIKDGTAIVKDEDGDTLIVTEPSVVLTGVKAGAHKYAVVPARFEDNPETGKPVVKASGVASAAKSLTVAALWNKVPVIKSAAQLKDEEKKIVVQWATSSVLPVAFEIRCKLGTRTTVVLSAQSFLDGMENGSITRNEKGVYTAVVDAMGAGNNVISVVAKYQNEATGAWSTGTPSATKTVAVKTLWSLAPVGVTVKQIKTTAELQEIMPADDVTVDEGMVLLKWKSGNNPNLAQSFKIYDNGVEIAHIDPISAAEPDNAYVMHFYGNGTYGENQVILLGQKAGAHKYTVKAVNDEGKAGTASAAKALTTVDLWKTKPTITKAIQSANGEITVSWKPGSELTTQFVVIDKLGKTTTTYKDYTYDADTDTYTLTASVANGTHEISVKPVNEKGASGTVSAVVKVAVANTNWNAAPVLESVEQNTIGEVTLTWRHASPADGFIVYEVKGSEFEQIHKTDKPVFTCTVPVETSGTHTYAVRSYMIDTENGGIELVGTMSRSKSATVYAPGDATPQNVRVTRERSTAVVSWDAVPFATGYRVTMVNLLGAPCAIHEVGSKTPAIFTSIPSDASYAFTVRAYFGRTYSDKVTTSEYVMFGKPVAVKAVFKPELGGVELTWEKGTDGLDGYNIYRLGEHNEEMQQIYGSNTLNTKRTYVDDLAQPNETYTYWVCSYRSSGEDELSAPVVVNTEVALEPVGKVTADYFNEYVTLEWDAVPNATAYDVFRAEGVAPEQDDFVRLSTIDANGEVVTYGDVVENADLAYTYRIVSVWQIGNSRVEGAPRNATVNPLKKPVITEAVFDAQKGAVKLSWNAVPGAIGYRVWRDDSELTSNLYADTTYYDNANIYLGSVYTYCVAAIQATSDVRDSGRTSEDKRVTVGNLGKVTGLTQWHENETVTLTWNALPSAQRYIVERSSDNGATYVVVNESVTETTFVDDQVSDGQTYLYRVRAALTVSGKTILGAYSEAVTADISPIMKITATFSLKKGGAVITWPKSDKKDVTGYKVFRTTTDENSEIELIAEVGKDATSLIDDANGLTVGKTYRYSVRVVRTSGEDGQSDFAEVEPIALGKVQNVCSRYIEHDTHLLWDAVEQADCYEVTRTGNGKTETFETEVNAENPTAVTDRVDDPEAEYVYTLRAVVKTEAGTSIYGVPSDPITVTRKPGAQNVNLSATEDGVQITWTPMDTSEMLGFWLGRLELDENSEPVVPAYTRISPEDQEESKELAKSGRLIDTTAKSGVRYVYSIDVLYPSQIEHRQNVRTLETNEIDVPRTFFLYDDNGDGTATITGYAGKRVAIMTNIPETVDGLTVTAIGDGEHPFSLPDGVTMTGTLTLPKTVKTIGKRAFYQFEGLTGTLALPDGLESIGEQAFARTGFTGGLTIPVSVTSLDNGAFNAIFGLTSVTFAGNANVTMGAGVFRNCMDLTSVSLPANQTEIPALFVEGNQVLTTISIPSSVTIIGERAFRDCAALTGELFIPDGVTSIGANAFTSTGYTSLRSYAAVPKAQLDAMGLPVTVVKLESDYDKEGEESFEAFGRALKAAHPELELILHGETSTGTLYVKDEDGNATIIGQKNASGALVLPATVGDYPVTKIGENAFKDNTAITSVTINGSVTEIGDGAFDGCSSLTTAVLPNTVEIIGARGFADCTRLSTMTTK